MCLVRMGWNYLWKETAVESRQEVELKTAE